jgi:hypothetical protein
VKRLLTILSFGLVLSLAAFAGQGGPLSGKGFFTTVQLGSDFISIHSVDAFTDGATVFFVLNYSSKRGCDAAFFDPPEKKVVKIAAASAIHEGDGSLVFSLPVAKAERAPGFTIMIDPQHPSQFVYFAITGGVDGLAHKEASEDIKGAAISLTPAS